MNGDEYAPAPSSVGTFSLFLMTKLFFLKTEQIINTKL